MTEIIFNPKKNNKAKLYTIFSSKDQGVYKKDEFVRNAKTDNIEKCLDNNQYEFYAVEKNG